MALRLGLICEGKKKIKYIVDWVRKLNREARESRARSRCCNR